MTSLEPTAYQQQAMIWLMDSMTIRAATILLGQDRVGILGLQIFNLTRGKS